MHACMHVCVCLSRVPDSKFADMMLFLSDALAFADVLCLSLSLSLSLSLMLLSR
jgi:hypothetical protein